MLVSKVTYIGVRCDMNMYNFMTEKGDALCKVCDDYDRKDPWHHCLDGHLEMSSLCGKLGVVVTGRGC